MPGAARNNQSGICPDLPERNKPYCAQSGSWGLWEPQSQYTQVWEYKVTEQPPVSQSIKVFSLQKPHVHFL